MAFDWQSGGDARGLELKPTAQLQRGQAPAVAVPIGIDGSDLAFALRAGGSHSGDKGDGGMNTTVVAVDTYNGKIDGDVAATMGTNGSPINAPGPQVMSGLAVRRLTPVECERLQGFPDHWTQIPYRGKPSTNCPDGPRYKALGNSMAVPVMRWIGERIQMANEILKKGAVEI